MQIISNRNQKQASHPCSTDGITNYDNWQESLNNQALHGKVQDIQILRTATKHVTYYNPLNLEWIYEKRGEWNEDPLKNSIDWSYTLSFLAPDSGIYQFRVDSTDFFAELSKKFNTCSFRFVSRFGYCCSCHITDTFYQTDSVTNDSMPLSKGEQCQGVLHFYSPPLEADSINPPVTSNQLLKGLNDSPLSCLGMNISYRTFS